MNGRSPTGTSPVRRLTGPEMIPYLSTYDGDAMPGGSQAKGGSENTWLLGSGLTSFILGRRIGSQGGLPPGIRRLGKAPHALPCLRRSPAPEAARSCAMCARTSTNGPESTFEGGGFLTPPWRRTRRFPKWNPCSARGWWTRRWFSEVTLKMVAPFGKLKPGDTFHFFRRRRWHALLGPDP